ncbi:unnamed protein product, partial [Laminaria digitata]
MPALQANVLESPYEYIRVRVPGSTRFLAPAPPGPALRTSPKHTPSSDSPHAASNLSPLTATTAQSTQSSKARTTCTCRSERGIASKHSKQTTCRACTASTAQRDQLCTTK